MAEDITDSMILAYERGQAKGRKEAYEHAARVAEGPAIAWGNFPGGTPERDKIAAAIRSLILTEAPHE